jgi:hypothetical protein
MGRSGQGSLRSGISITTVYRLTEQILVIIDSTELYENIFVEAESGQKATHEIRESFDFHSIDPEENETSFMHFKLTLFKGSLSKNSQLRIFGQEFFSTP